MTRAGRSKRRRAAYLGSAGAVAATGVTGGLAAMAMAASPAGISLTPDCGSAGNSGTYSVDVRGHDFDPDATVAVTFDAGRGVRPETFDTSTDGFGGFDVTIHPTRRGNGSYDVRADDFRQREATASFTVPCTSPPVTPPPSTPSPSPTHNGRPGSGLQPHIRVRTPIGIPGFVTIVDGFDFPKGAVVVLRWSTGIRPPIVVHAIDGTFSQPMLVFPRDLPGARQVTAVRGSSGPAFPAVTPADFLVVLGPNEPPGVQVRR